MWSHNSVCPTCPSIPPAARDYRLLPQARSDFQHGHRCSSRANQRWTSYIDAPRQRSTPPMFIMPHLYLTPPYRRATCHLDGPDPMATPHHLDSARYTLPYPRLTTVPVLALTVPHPSLVRPTGLAFNSTTPALSSPTLIRL